MALPDPILGDTVMHYAVKQHRYPELLEMLCHGGNPFVKNKEGESVASILENSSMDEAIVDEENSISMKDDTILHPMIVDGELSPLQQQRHSKIIQEIKSKIEEMNTAQTDIKETNESLVHRAVRQNNLKKLILYKKFGACFHSFNLRGQTPQELANEFGYTDVSNFLKRNTRDLSQQYLSAQNLNAIELSP